MSDSEPLTIACEAKGVNAPGDGKVRAVIEFEFDDVEADHVGMWTRLRVEDSKFETGRWFYWWNIQAFADGLEKMHSDLKGSCSLSDWDGETVLCMSLFDPVRGLIGIGGQLVQHVFSDNVVPKGDLVFPSLYGNWGGIVVSFEGLVTDQSYLPPVISGLRLFLSESGIEHRPPWP